MLEMCPRHMKRQKKTVIFLSRQIFEKAVTDTDLINNFAE
jgi:hypothetical protein